MHPPESSYRPIEPASSAQVTLDGSSLTVSDLMEIAENGAAVRIAPEAVREAERNLDLLNAAAAEGLAVYGVNRGSGAERERHRTIASSDSRVAARGSRNGALPEIGEEMLVRATMAVRANAVRHGAASREYIDLLVAMLNRRVAPVMYARGSLGEGDFPLVGNIAAGMVGRGHAHFEGRRMKAADALKTAGLEPLRGSVGGGTSHAYGNAHAAGFVHEVFHLLKWCELAYAVDLLAMNSNISPLVAPVQRKRPVAATMDCAERVLGVLRGSFLFEADDTRKLQDPESLRASFSRQGAAWQAWRGLKAALETQLNSGEQNPTLLPGVHPDAHPDLSSPHFLRYYVHPDGEKLIEGGFVLPSANWDPYPLANEIEALTNALANLAAAVSQRIERFSDRGPSGFFTGVLPADILGDDTFRRSPRSVEPYFVFMDLWAEIQFTSRNVTPEGSAMDFGVADIEAFTRLKCAKGREVVDLMYQLISFDLLDGCYWLDVRLTEKPERSLSPATAMLHQQIRDLIPWQREPDDRSDEPMNVTIYRFLRSRGSQSHSPEFDILYN